MKIQSLQGMRALDVEFDGSWLRVSGDAAEVLDLLQNRCRHVLSQAGNSPIGFVEVHRDGSWYRVDTDESSLTTGASASGVAEFVVEQILGSFMRARKEFLWLHAAAVARNGRAVILPAESGRGKSTVATHLSGMGWQFLSDDIVALRLDKDEVIAFPLIPSRRVPAERQSVLNDVPELVKEAVDIPSDMVMRGATQVGVVVFPGFDVLSQPELRAMRQGDAAIELLRHTRNLAANASASAERVSRLMRHVEAFALRFGVDGRGVELINECLLRNG